MFQGREVSPDRLVAIKAFTFELTSAQATILADSLRSLVDLDLAHPSAVTPIAAGLEGDTPYLVEEYVFGESLDVALQRYGPAPAADAARLITQVALALDAASRVGVLHGALHPRDVLVTPDLVRVTGLGVLKSLERAGAHPPPRPSYSAPEQNAGESWEGRADVFSLAAIAAELLTGRSATAPDGTAVLDFEGLLVARPEELRQVLSRGLASEPEHRYATAGDLAAALELALTGRSSRPAGVEKPSKGVAAARPGEAARGRRARRRRQAVVLSEAQSPAAEAVPVQPTLAGIADEADAATAVAAGSDLPPAEIAPPVPAAPDAGDTFRLTTPEQPALDPGLVELSPIEPRPGDVVPAVSVVDLSLEPQPVAAELSVEQPGSLPFEERGPAPQAPEPVASLGGVDAEPPLGVPAEETSAMPDRRSVGFPAAMALAAVIIGISGWYLMMTPRVAPPAASTAVSTPAVAPAAAPAAPDIYLPAAPGPPRTEASPGSAARSNTRAGSKAPAASGRAGAAAAHKTPASTPKATTTPKAKASSATAGGPAAAKPAAGSLSIESRPAGARVFVDGRPSGTTPLVLPALTAGSHDVRLERPGYRAWSSKVRVTSGRRARLTASLESESIR